MKLSIRTFLIIVFLSANFYSQDWIKYLTKSISGIGTSKVVTLKDAKITVHHRSNCYPKKQAAIEDLYISDFLENNGALITISFCKSKGLGVFEIDGTVTCDGTEKKSWGNGIYAAKFSNNKSKKIILKTSSKETNELNASPQISIKVVEPKNSKIELQKGVKIKVDNEEGYNFALNPILNYSLYSSPNGIEFFISTYAFGLSSGKGVTLQKLGTLKEKIDEKSIFNFPQDVLYLKMKKHLMVMKNFGNLNNY